MKKNEKAKTNPLQKLFGGINLTWPILIIASIIIGVLVGVIMLVPAFKDTSISQIGVIFYWWWFFAIIVITNSKSNLDSALKCFVFFLISQPLIYLVQVPFNDLGWGIFGYYRNWILWTIATLPMGYIGYWIKKQNIWSAIILAPAICWVAAEGLGEGVNSGHYLGSVFCLTIVIVLLMGVLNNWKLRGISVAIAAAMFAILSIALLFTEDESSVNLVFDVSEEFSIAAEKEWHIESSDINDNLTLETEDVYDEDGNPTGEKMYLLRVEGLQKDVFGTHEIRFVGGDETKVCTLELNRNKKTIEQELSCE